MKATLETVDSYVTRIAEMERGELIREILTFRCTFPLDFTREYLAAQTADQLRHILMAATMHSAPSL
jgi:hypothetical protein